MQVAIRVIAQLLSTKQGRSSVGHILLGVFALFVLPVVIIGGAATSFLDKMQNETDVFFNSKNEVREELKIKNDMDPIFIRFLFYSMDPEEIPEEKAVIFTIKLFFINRVDDPILEKKIETLEAQLKAAETEQERERLYAALQEARKQAASTTHYSFKSEEELFALFEDPDSDFTDAQVEELKEMIRAVHQMEAQAAQTKRENALPHDKWRYFNIFSVFDPTSGDMKRPAFKPNTACRVPISIFSNCLVSP